MTYQKQSSSAISNFSTGSPRCAGLVCTRSSKLHLNTPACTLRDPKTSYLSSLCFSELFTLHFFHLCSSVGTRLGDRKRLGELDRGPYLLWPNAHLIQPPWRRHKRCSYIGKGSLLTLPMPIHPTVTTVSGVLAIWVML